ncbi:MAG: hypothetical protein GY866_10020 [Proteobacteria bacterium]|nr:hypothetical protein [Pseudomonadota bacterium]
MESIPFFLVTGFLGSGKTTLLKNFLQAYADDRKIAVIQNEFAEGNVDGRELRETGKTFEMLEINRGSVFCVCLLSDFTRSLKDLVDTCRPEAVILEATGLADPIAIGQLLQAAELDDRLYLSHVWCVVDASSFPVMERSVTRISHQVRVADTVVVNKTDLASADDLRLTEARVSALNPHAEIIHSRFCDLSLSTAFDAEANRALANAADGNDLEQCSEGRPQISSVLLRTTSRISEEGLTAFLKQFEKKAYRIKGYVNLADDSSVSVQSCFGETHLKPVERIFGPTELIALGPDIEHREFSRFFEKLARN